MKFAVSLKPQFLVEQLEKRAATIKDKNNGKEYTIKTVRTAEEISGIVEEEERDVLMEKRYDLGGQY